MGKPNVSSKPPIKIAEKKSGRKVRVSGISVLQYGKFMALTFALLGLVMGVFMTFMFTILGSIIPGIGGLGTGIGVVATIIMVILFGIEGFVIGALGALIYNFVAGRIGGIEVEVE